MTETMEKRLEQLENGVIDLCVTVSQLKESLCGNKKATNKELLTAVDQLKSRLAQVEKDLAFKEKCLEWRYNDIARAEDMIDDLNAKLAQVEKERDAAVFDLHGDCDVCKNGGKTCMKCVHCLMSQEATMDSWEWRGVCAENTGEDANV